MKSNISYIGFQNYFEGSVNITNKPEIISDIMPLRSWNPYFSLIFLSIFFQTYEL